MQDGTVVWFTGLSGSGKSTLCEAVASELRARREHVQILDADEVRRELCSDLGFSLSDRQENIRRLTYLSKLVAGNGIVVLVAAICPLNDMRTMMRAAIPTVIQVFVDAPLEICESRDPKGLYKRARNGLIKNVTGIDSPFEPPNDPTITCYTAKESIAESADKVVSVIYSDRQVPLVREKTRRNTVAVDFDGVIADYSGWRGEGVHGLPRRDVVQALTALREEGWKIVIHTTRCGAEISNYLTRYQIPYDEINENSDYASRGSKPVATVYWDDRAVRYSGDAAHDIQLIRSFSTWSGRR